MSGIVRRRDAPGSRSRSREPGSIALEMRNQPDFVMDRTGRPVGVAESFIACHLLFKMIGKTLVLRGCDPFRYALGFIWITA